jgi:hypothetical protein
MVKVSEPVWTETIRQLRTCGARQVECVVYWVGSNDTPDVVDRAIHPAHVSTDAHYKVDQGWMHQFLVSLYRERRTIRAQVHTHRGRAFHSATDDAWPAVNTQGFYSLVLPRFAHEPLEADKMWLAVLRRDGSWDALRAREAIEGLP